MIIMKQMTQSCLLYNYSTGVMIKQPKVYIVINYVSYTVREI